MRSNLGAKLAAKKSLQRNKRAGNKIRKSIKNIKADMVEIREQQKLLREGQKEVRDKFEEIRIGSAVLREETNLISQQIAANQVRLDLMLQIVKARREKDSSKDAQLTHALRELVENRNMNKSKALEENHPVVM